jgi:hypothetical protein
MSTERQDLTLIYDALREAVGEAGWCNIEAYDPMPIMPDELRRVAEAVHRALGSRASLGGGNSGPRGGPRVIPGVGSTGQVRVFDSTAPGGERWVDQADFPAAERA